MNITLADIEKGRKILEFERLSSVTSDSVFAAGIYCILSSREFFKKQVQVYHNLEINSMITPRNILNDTKKLREPASHEYDWRVYAFGCDGYDEIAEAYEEQNSL